MRQPSEQLGFGMALSVIESRTLIRKAVLQDLTQP